MRADSVLITAPTADVLPLAAAKDHLRANDFGDEDTLIESIIDAVVAMLDPAAGGTLGRALRPQTWELRLSHFDAHRHCWPTWQARAIELPYPPLIEVVSLKYDDTSGVERTLTLNTDFRILGSGSNGKQAIVPLFGGCWPVARCTPESVRIRYTCGYPAADAAADPPVVDTLPPQLVAWIKLVVGSLYENRESIVTGLRAAAIELPPSVLQMISSLKVYG